MTVKKALITPAAAEVPDLPLHQRGLSKALIWNDVGGDSTTETESGASSSTEDVEVESPRSAAPRWRPTRPRKKAANVHSQVLRVREEDAHVGEDIAAVGFGNSYGGVSPVLPCSRLSHLAATVNTASVS